DSEILPVLIPSIKLILIAVYHPFWKDTIKNECAISCIIDIINYVVALPHFDVISTRITVCGDFNDLVSDLGDLEEACGLRRIVMTNTRKNRILDQILTNITCAPDSRPEVLAPFGRSDHAVVYWSPHSVTIPTVTKKRIRNFCNDNRQSFDRTVSLVNWNVLQDFHDVDFAFTVFQNTLRLIFESCFPYISVRFRSNDPPWMNGELKILLDKRDRAFSKRQMRKYLSLRSKVIRLACSLKCNFLKDVLPHLNTRSAWKRIRRISRIRKNENVSPLITASSLNDYFASIFQVGDNAFPSADSLLSLPSQSLVVSDFEINNHLKRLCKGSGGPDGLPFWTYKHNSFVFSSVIAYFFNHFFRVGHLPNSFKYANVIPIPKCSKPVSPNDFRPISMLPVLSKIMEKIVASNWILPVIIPQLQPSQFAYIPGSGGGTASALTLVSHKILSFLDSKSGAVRVVAADFSKAFDKLTFDSIVSSLVKFKLSYEAVCFIVDFLSCRKQRVLFSDVFSEWSEITSGVPQGSVLGPILFAMVIDSLVPLCHNSAYIKYADDVTILHFIRSDEDDMLQQEWSHLENWSKSVGLSLNYSKCHVMNCVTKSVLSPRPIRATDDMCLPTVSSMRLLGVIFSDDLKWNLHVEDLVKRCYRRFYIIRNLYR
ncbi:MAG: reverse transcriptase family protein, partial [Pseudomonadota bacterium]